LEETKKEIDLLGKLYNLYSEVLETFSKWNEIPWTEVNDQLQGMIDQIETYSMSCTRLDKSLKKWSAYDELRQKIEKYQNILPLVRELAKTSVRPRHWDELISKTSKQIPYKLETFTLGILLSEIEVDKYHEDIEEIGESADKQLKIENQLAEITRFWAEA